MNDDGKVAPSEAFSSRKGIGKQGKDAHNVCGDDLCERGNVNHTKQMHNMRIVE